MSALVIVLICCPCAVVVAWPVARSVVLGAALGRGCLLVGSWEVALRRGVLLCGGSIGDGIVVVVTLGVVGVVRWCWGLGKGSGSSWIGGSSVMCASIAET